MMIYDDNPSKKVLDGIQRRLTEENSAPNNFVGITDIWMNFSGKYYVAIDNNTAVAVAAVADHGELYKLYVLPENRKKGIAEQFVLYLIKKIAVSNKDALFVEMTNQSIPFWERLIQKNDVSFEQYEGQLKIELWIN
ncbi:TPA: GNAT family N-acetyltransferase [Proteus mirabilis]|nr:GNAT family N-acetyltransferase [Proteus mirabilis]AUU38413.1 N-acetyltransferase [Proteus mirabilis]EKX8017575.1 GNAT family N-acetyltransferase [Proteus mirabilis]EKX9512445.1 GNAT family N-acetyltransferase [Proteus mirabilis]ELT1803322.1 GNAT family N-acetyltransferase [Proteus mirabilis]KAB7711945.1 GNAT family N-acetyltransferase [Proteus mirabilis]